jgi:hypothetical protein
MGGGWMEAAVSSAAVCMSGRLGRAGSQRIQTPAGTVLNKRQWGYRLRSAAVAAPDAKYRGLVGSPPVGRAWMADRQPSAAEHRMDPHAQSAAPGCADNALGPPTAHRAARVARSGRTQGASCPGHGCEPSGLRLVAGFLCCRPMVAPLSHCGGHRAAELLLGGWGGMARHRPTEQPTTWPPALQPAIAAIAAATHSEPAPCLRGIPWRARLASRLAWNAVACRGCRAAWASWCSLLVVPVRPLCPCRPWSADDPRRPSAPWLVEAPSPPTASSAPAPSPV